MFLFKNDFTRPSEHELKLKQKGEKINKTVSEGSISGEKYAPKTILKSQKSRV